MNRHGKPLWTPPQEVKDVVQPASEPIDCELIDTSKMSSDKIKLAEEAMLNDDFETLKKLFEEDTDDKQEFGEDLED